MITPQTIHKKCLSYVSRPDQPENLVFSPVCLHRAEGN